LILYGFVLGLDVILVWLVWNRAPSRFLKIYVLLLLSGLVFAIVWISLSYAKSDYLGTIKAFRFLTNTPITLAYFLYACRIHNLADSVWSLKHAGAEGCFRKIRPFKVLVAILIVAL